MLLARSPAVGSASHDAGCAGQTILAQRRLKGRARHNQRMVMARLIGTRYVVPLREGGSLPAVVETVASDDVTPGGSFVVKFLGAGQGARALIAEALVAGLALALGLPVPEPAIVTLEE